jgi:lipopolysaccharide cholinephosphotransferase
MAKIKASLTKRNLESARKVLFTITALLSQHKIPYHLEGGTLLGIVRDNDLLPWDNDVDISVPSAFAGEILKLRFALLLKGYKISCRRSLIDVGPIRQGQYSAFKIKPILGYMAHWFLPSYEQHFIVMDIFMKTSDQQHTYWQAKDKVMRVGNKYYESFETVDYQEHSLRVPNHFKEYLTQKYGNWSVPVKDWDCGENELTIIK